MIFGRRGVEDEEGKITNSIAWSSEHGWCETRFFERHQELKRKKDFTFLDANGVVVARLTGYEAVMDASLSKAFKAQHAA